MPAKKNRTANWDPYWVIEDAQALQRVVEALHGQDAKSVESDPVLSQGMYRAQPILLEPP